MEIRINNEHLAKHLENGGISDLISFITSEPAMDTGAIRCFKVPFLAHECFSQFSSVIHKILESEDLLLDLLSFLDRADSLN